ncbi:MAG TPA: thiamine pyrophosphate-binding protein [Vicinamibacterales bacterium]|nr:thiamine pyrophosphate-binding protein [Vicinamibacterales bacterium]
MPTCADVVARTLREAGVTRIFGLPGGEILGFVEAARRAGIRFILTRHEAHAAFMADATGQLTRRPGVCVSTLGPGAVNLALGVANAWLDRSPVIAITATHTRASAPYATHQNLDLNAVYRPFTKVTRTIDGADTAAKVAHAINLSLAPRMGPVHLALPADVAAAEECDAGQWIAPAVPAPAGPASDEDIAQLAAIVRSARRPVVILGLDLDPFEDGPGIREFVEAFGAPVFVTPKAKGLLSEDHPLFCGVCAGVSADAEILDFFQRADLLVGIGFDPVESDKLWHYTMRLVSIGPMSISARAYRPMAECVGELHHTLDRLRRETFGPFDWTEGDRQGVRDAVESALRPAAPPDGLSGYELTRRLRDLFPRETIFVTDVGSVKMVTTQAWRSYEPLTFLESNGLSAMGYSLPAAIAARLEHPDRPVLCTVGDGGFGMTLAEIETCVRERVRLVVVVFNDSSLSLIDVAQQRRGYPTVGVRHAPVDFAAAAVGFGAWSRRVARLDELEDAVRAARQVDGPAVLDIVVDPAEYVRQTAGHRAGA